MLKLKIEERGWAGHYICAYKCTFRRNTLITYGTKKIVVSTVGARWDEENRKHIEIGCDRAYETMAFHVKKQDLKYFDADVSKQIYFKSDWTIEKFDENSTNKANDMHEKVVKELSKRLKLGKRLGKYC